jgi:hypothetical protein
MVAPNRAAAGMGYIGYPAQIFYEKVNYGNGQQSHLEKIIILDKWYSDLRAYLPVKMEKEIEEYNKDFFPALARVDIRLCEAWDAYRPEFESLESCNPDEKLFILMLRGIMIELDEITANSKVIDKEGNEMVVKL